MDRQFAIASALLHGASRVLAIDTIPSRLEMAQGQGAEVVDFQAEDPVQMILRLTAGIGVDRVIDVVGVDATRPLTQAEPLVSAIDTYQTFDARRPGWMKVKLEPRMA